MGSIAILQKPEQPILIKRLEAQLWMLSGVLNAQRLWLDVGVLLKTSTNDVDSLEMLVPFEVSSFEDPVCLRKYIGQSGTLILGHGATMQCDYSIVVMDGIPAAFREVNVKVVTSSEQNGKELQARGFDLLRLSFHKVDPNTLIYIRFRLPVNRTYRMVMWRRSLLGRVGAQIDLRVSDLRELATPVFDSITTRMVSAPDVELSAVVRASLKLLDSSPRVTSIRLLEPGAWEGYIDRKLDLRNEGALVVYTLDRDQLTSSVTSVEVAQPVNSVSGGAVESSSKEFDSTPKESLEDGATEGLDPSLTGLKLEVPMESIASPTSWYLDFSREVGLLPFGNFLRIGVIVFFLLLINPAEWRTRIVRDIGGVSLFSLHHAIAWIVILGALGFGALVAFIQKVRVSLIRWYRRQERALWRSQVPRP